MYDTFREKLIQACKNDSYISFGNKAVKLMEEVGELSQAYLALARSHNASRTALSKPDLPAEVMEEAADVMLVSLDIVYNALKHRKNPEDAMITALHQCLIEEQNAYAFVFLGSVDDLDIRLDAHMDAAWHNEQIQITILLISDAAGRLCSCLNSMLSGDEDHRYGNDHMDFILGVAKDIACHAMKIHWHLGIDVDIHEFMELAEKKTDKWISKQTLMKYAAYL